MNLNILMQNGITGIMKTVGRFYLRSAQGRRFLSQIVPAIRNNADIRMLFEKQGTHIPPFLIASITSRCNLHCAGCYARASNTCQENGQERDLSTAEWTHIFKEASHLGVSFILLAGGEPMMRLDVIKAAAQFKNILFPIFTNGTMMDNAYLTLFDTYRNLIPVLSIEGDKNQTDTRRGHGMYDTVEAVMKQLGKNKILYGTSITVTKENVHAVTAGSFMADLRKMGCGIVFFVPYVPVAKGTEYLMLNEDDTKALECTITKLKEKHNDMVLLSFPGDEAALGGCLASGRGFFHINPKGGAEPCPFSPHSKYNLKDRPMLDILKSSYFQDLQELAANAGEHTGGCTLFEHNEQVLALLMS